MTIMTRRHFGRSVAVGSLALFAASNPAITVAQEATPGVAEFNPFGNTELIEIPITASEFTYSASLPGALGEGWYIITLINESEAVADVNLALLPEGTTAGDLSAAVSGFGTAEGAVLPEWADDTTFAGGNITAAGETNSTLAYLTPGQWTMFSAHVGAAQSPASFTILTPEELEASYGIAPEATPVGATPIAEATPVTEAPAGVVATVTIEVTDNQIIPDGTPAGGEQVIQVINNGQQPHNLIMLQTEDVLDEENAASLATSWIMGEETAATPAGGVGMLSPGQTAFTGVMVEAGNYVVFSSLPDEAGGLQVDAGVVTIFTAQ